MSARPLSPYLDGLVPAIFARTALPILLLPGLNGAVML